MHRALSTTSSWSQTCPTLDHTCRWIQNYTRHGYPPSKKPAEILLKSQVYWITAIFFHLRCFVETSLLHMVCPVGGSHESSLPYATGTQYPQGIGSRNPHLPTDTNIHACSSFMYKGLVQLASTGHPWLAESADAKPVDTECRLCTSPVRPDFLLLKLPRDIVNFKERW